MADFDFVSGSDIAAEDWNRAAAASAHFNFLQTWEYGEAKSQTGPWRVERGKILHDGVDAGLAQALIRRAPFGMGGLVWINRGPLPILGSHDNPTAIADMIAALREHYVTERKFYFRVAPVSEVGAMELEELKRRGMVRTDTLGWASAKLDLTLSLSDLRKSLKAKWRGHLNKGEREIDSVRSGAELETFHVFLDQHQEFAAARNFATSVDTAFFKALYAETPSTFKPEAFIAYASNRVIGSILIVKYGNVCEYLAGNTTPEGRKLNAGQLLLWQSITAMKAQGFAQMDLSGMDPLQTPKGIFQFKEGLNGSPYRLENELECATGLTAKLIGWRTARARRRRRC